MDSSPKVIGSDYLVIVSGDFGRRECGKDCIVLGLSPKVIGTDSPVINPVTSVVENVVGLYHPWTLSPKVIQRLFVFELWIAGCC